MDTDLIKLVNKLQDTFTNLGTSLVSLFNGQRDLTCVAGGELDMPQLVVASLHIDFHEQTY
jgi:hypothetical protein